MLILQSIYFHSIYFVNYLFAIYLCIYLFVFGYIYLEYNILVCALLDL